MVTLQALFAIIPQHLFGPYVKDDRVVRELFASYTTAVLNTTYDTPASSPVDDGSRGFQSNSLAEPATLATGRPCQC